MSVNGWNQCWESIIYSQGKHLNLYPHHAVVRFILSQFGKISDRSQVRILELGCGAGNNVWFMAREGFSVFGIDGSVSAINFAKNRFAKEKLNGDLRVGSFVSLPWPEQYFDAVIDRGSLTCTSWEVIEQTLVQTKKVLKNNGIFFSMIYSDKHPDKNYGEIISKSTYGKFRSGYFKDLESIVFLNRENIDDLYGKYFKVISLIHNYEEDCLNGVRGMNALWEVHAK